MSFGSSWFYASQRLIAVPQSPCAYFAGLRFSFDYYFPDSIVATVSTTADALAWPEDGLSMSFNLPVAPETRSNN
jgi:hypothetical protein